GSFVETVTENDIEQVAAELAGARLPVLVGGAGIRNSAAAPLFREFAESLKCPVVFTHGGRGVLPDTHPQVLDYGLEPGLTVTRDADVVFVVGSSIGEKIGFGGNPYFHGQEGFTNLFGERGRQRWIHLNQDVSAIGRNRDVDVALVGDMRRVLPRLTAALRRSPVNGTPQLPAWQQQRRERYRALFAEAPDMKPIHSGRMMVEIQKALPDDVVIINGGGAVNLWTQYYQCHNIAGQLKSSKLGNLGTGVPYAMGAALALREAGNRVCVLGGDGGFGFYPMELETAVRYQLPIVVIVGYDAGWSLEVPYYTYLTGMTFEVDHNFMRLDELARTMGAHGEFCETTDQIAPAVRRAFASGKPALVQVVIDRATNAYKIPNLDQVSRFHADKQVYVNRADTQAKED
ncbi:MAG TPA: thiamine pyrophosphate-dependent enzyme, partial [Burkholderiaceae bacterium]|nr:thiamine pyrophosphate-dependent enzyme [Burkholderiaceae bacterium]